MAPLRSTHHEGTHVEKGRSLARGPALLLGTLLTACGLLGLIDQNDFPPTGGFPDGTADGGTLLGFELNGWTNWLLIACGATLLLGAAQHVLARFTSLAVALVLGAASVIALSDGDDVLGLAAANGPTKLGLGLASALLLITSLMPRRGHRTHDHDHRVESTSDDRPAVRPVAARPVADEAPPRTERPVDPSTERGALGPDSDRTGRFDRPVEERTRVTDDVASSSRGGDDRGERPQGERFP